MLITWVLFLIWTLGYNATHAFDAEKSSLDPILGMPRWVFFGILIPWVVALMITIWFAARFMKDTQLIDGEEDRGQPEEEISGDANHSAEGGRS